MGHTDGETRLMENAIPLYSHLEMVVQKLIKRSRMHALWFYDYTSIDIFTP